MDASTPAADRDQHVEFLLRIGDTALVLAQRLSAWVGSGPTLEEEVALANVALDLLGQATMVLEHAAAIEGAGRTADDLAYLRDAHDFRNLLLAELPNGDFAHTIVRQVMYEAWAHELWGSLAASTDEVLAGIAGKAAKETWYHLEHASMWLVRLGDGTDESRAHTVAALEALWPYGGEAFIADEADDAMVAAGIAPERCDLLADRWRTQLASLVEAAGLELPADVWQQRGGKQGRHTEHLGYVLAELQYLQRAYPGATW